MKYISLTILAGCLVFLCSADLLAAEKCFKCHSKEAFSKKYSHQPVAAGACVKCHNPHVSKYKGLLAEEKTELCYVCHDGLREALKEGKVLHSPFATGDCLACHDPHSSAKKGLIKKSEARAVCFECHGDLDKKNKSEHAPFATGNCQACHSPHVAGRIQLLLDEPEKLCISCHKSNITDAHRKIPVKVTDKGCLTCHNPHGSDRHAMIRNVLHVPYEDGSCGECHSGGQIAGEEKCLECHDSIGEKLNSIHSHPTSPRANGCANCHSPHASDFTNMLRNRQSQVCRECHYDTWEVYNDKPHKHPNSEVCSNCHGIHGSNYATLLKEEGSETCKACHATQGVFTHPVGEGVFDPRNGQIMTCVTCHYPHGTIYTSNLKFSGSMELCIQCHKNY